MVEQKNRMYCMVTSINLRGTFVEPRKEDLACVYRFTMHYIQRGTKTTKSPFQFLVFRRDIMRDLCSQGMHY